MIDGVLERQMKKMVDARIPLVEVVSPSEDVVEDTLRALVNAGAGPAKEYFAWTMTDGIRAGQGFVDRTEDIREALTWALRHPRPAVFFFKDLHHYLRGDPWVLRRLKDLATTFPSQGKYLFLRAIQVDLPDELRQQLVVVEHALPARPELEQLFDYMMKSRKVPAGAPPPPTPHPALRQAFVTAGLGLTLTEAHRAFRRALAGGQSLEGALIAEVMEEKRQVVNKTGILEFIPPASTVIDVGGMDNLKGWLEKRRHVLTDEARKQGVTPPKGVLIMGISGCGKSHFVKSIANFWRVPLLRLDMAQVYAGIGGSPETAIRTAIRTAEGMAPCVLWIDEIEAGISVGGQKAEGGPASRVLGFFLTWMQEKSSPVFVGATANAIDLLPAEVLRKGRFDEIFYVSLPTKAEREEVFKVHLLKRGVNPKDLNLGFLATSTRGFSGSEIEQVVASGLVDAMAEGQKLNENHLAGAISRTVPLSITMAEQIKKIEAWAQRRAVPASKREDGQD
jgi:vesicle-fusing ATPase